MTRKFFFFFVICLLSTYVSAKTSELSKQQSLLSCCVHNPNSVTITPFADTSPGAVTVSPQGCLTLIQNQDTSVNLISYQINSSSCTLERIDAGPYMLFAPRGLTYTPDGSCLIAFSSFTTDTPPSFALFYNNTGCTNTFVNHTPLPTASAIAASNTCVTVAQGTAGTALWGPLSSCYSSLEHRLSEFFNIVTYSPDGTCLAAIDISGNIVTYPVNADCTLGTNVSTITGLNAIGLAFSPNGSCLVVTQSTNYVSSFSVTNCELSLQPISTVPTDPGPLQISFSPSGNCFAVATTGSGSGIVDIYSINSGCEITQTDTITDSSESEGRAVGWSPDGTCLFFFTSANLITAGFTAAPIITISTPSPIKICQGNSFMIDATVTGNTPGFTLQWYNGTTAIPGATSATLTVTNASPLDSGSYTLVATNTLCSVTSTAVQVTVTPIVITPSQSSYCVGDTIILTASPAGGTDYSWATPRGLIDTGSNNVLLITNAQISDVGNYSVTVTIDDCSGTGTLNNGFIVIYCSNLTISILCDPRIRPDATVTYTIIVTNSGPNAAENVTITSLLPSCITFESTQNQGWAITTIGQTVTATLPVSLATGETGSFIITGKAHCKRCQNATIISTVSAEGALSKTVSCSSFVR